MDGHKHSTQIEWLEVVETGRRQALAGRREASDRDGDLGDAACDLVNSETQWDITLIADDVAARLPRRACGRWQSGFVRAVVATAKAVAPKSSASTTGRMVMIEIGKDPRYLDSRIAGRARARGNRRGKPRMIVSDNPNVFLFKRKKATSTATLKWLLPVRLPDSTYQE